MPHEAEEGRARSGEARAALREVRAAREQLALVEGHLRMRRVRLVRKEGRDVSS